MESEMLFEVRNCKCFHLHILVHVWICTLCFPILSRRQC